ncbi:hypothetical protein [Actinoplanes sp. NPDC051859]|uniref:hypothetical protein n=1 Tax=Actinoplanes sp. NPDC051859 TaxID=3363909 RepID=UPI0037A3DC14
MVVGLAASCNNGSMIAMMLAVDMIALCAGTLMALFMWLIRKPVQAFQHTLRSASNNDIMQMIVTPLAALFGAVTACIRVNLLIDDHPRPSQVFLYIALAVGMLVVYGREVLKPSADLTVPGSPPGYGRAFTS